MADDTDDTPKVTAKPATTRRRAPRKEAVPKSPAKPVRAAGTTKTTAASKRPTATPKPRPTSRPTPATKRRAPTTVASKTTIEKATDRIGGKWGAAAIAGGLAAVGAAATAALLSLRSSTPKGPGTDDDALVTPDGGAHTADGADASRSFKAGIADENSIPD